MDMPTNCVGCNRAVRASRTPVADAPGTIPYSGRGFCKTCHQQASRPTRPAPEEWTVAPIIVIPSEAEDWRNDAACLTADPEMFFPNGGSTVAATRICDGCDVQAQCLEWALENDVRYGLWGGLSENQRARMRRQLKREDA